MLRFPKNKERVYVSKSDYDLAMKADEANEYVCTTCVVAQALKRRFKGFKSVGVDTAFFTRGNFSICEAGVQLIQEFDAGKFTPRHIILTKV